ncbi:MAG: discoidin domain-containing protein, partial [Dysgonamonadaceae bacterium]|nr:discoidin domain-containing protein [Dysgonamonadaceae bacterium]
YQNKDDNKKEAVFDGDPLTYFDAIEEKGSWAGLDLGEPKEIGEVNYLFRNDDNNIRLGDEYELFYFGINGWTSLGRQFAGSSTLVYENAPTKALFWLRNHTRGKEEIPFSNENGEQVFWEI